MATKPKPDRSIILVVGGDNYYAKPFAGLGRVTGDSSVLRESPDDVAFLVFTGGEDVDPAYYGEPTGSRTYSSPARDRREVAVFAQAKELGIPMVGICRGSQFLCVMNGGKLAQDITGHAVGGTHAMQTHDGRIIQVTSTHHQMQLPPADARVLSYAHPRLSRHYLNGLDREIDPRPEYEYEGVLYPLTSSLGMQWHPEYMDEDSDGFKYARQLVEEFIYQPE